MIVRLDPRCPGAYNVHAGAAASVASPVYSLDLYHNSLRISQARTNLAIAKIPRLEPGTHTFKAVLPGGQTAEIRIVVN